MENIKKGQEYLGLVIEKKEDLNNILQVLEKYNGEIPVVISIKDKKYKANQKVNVSDDLISELSQYVKKEKIIRFKKI